MVLNQNEEPEKEEQENSEPDEDKKPTKREPLRPGQTFGGAGAEKRG
jgi:hypothetical protein